MRLNSNQAVLGTAPDGLTYVIEGPNLGGDYAVLADDPDHKNLRFLRTDGLSLTIYERELVDTRHPGGREAALKAFAAFCGGVLQLQEDW